MKHKKLIIISTAIIISLSLGLPLYFHYSRIYWPGFTINEYVLNPDVGEKWTLNVTVTMPGGCIAMKTPSMKINEKEYSVFITLKAKRHSGICTQMVYYLNYLFDIIFPETGNWTVHCNDKTFTVYVQEPCFC
jgi:hypothetical protein